MSRQKKPVELMAFCCTEETSEYCAFEYFNASCRSPTERIYIRSAQYGRMRVGRCVKVDLGYLGCAADVRHVIESRCSGRRRCSVAVADDELRTRSPCPTDVTWYLQVSYACVTGQLINSRHSVNERPNVIRGCKPVKAYKPTKVGCPEENIKNTRK